MNHSMPGLPVHHQLPEFTQTHVHRDSDAFQPSHPVIPFSSFPQSLPASQSFPMSQLFAWGSQSTGVSALASFLPKKPQGWSPSELIGWKSWITINWQIVKEMGIPDQLTYLLRILYASQEATVRTGHRKTDWFQIGKEVHQAVHCHPAYLTYMQSTSWETLGWRKHKLESRFSGKLSITSDMQMTPPLWQKVKKN